MLFQLRDYFAAQPAIFSFLRRIIELGFSKEKKIIREVFSHDSAGRILDIGCGTGEFSGSFPNFSYTGIDISPAYIAYAKKRYRRNFIVMDAMHLQFAADSYDAVFIMAILHHLSQAQVNSVLQEAKRVVKTGGKVLILEDARIKEKENLFTKFVQNFDKGAYIREPAAYREMADKYFEVIREWRFRSGACTYYGLLMQK